MSPHAALSLALLMASPALADHKRELGAHEHGHGALDMALEGAVLTLELKVPGADIAGFEHAAVNEADKAALAAATEKLRDPLALFSFPKAAGCTVISALVEIETEGHHHGEAGHDDNAVKAGGEAEEGHSEFHAAYSLACTDPGALTEMRFPFFVLFPNAQELELQVAGPKGAKGFEVEREAGALALGEVF